jgi:lipid A 3-O-deacylase
LKYKDISILLKTSAYSNKTLSLSGLILTFIFIHCCPEKALAFTPGVSFSYGTGKPDHLKGYRIALQDFWPWLGFAESALNLTGYWDLSVAHWTASPPLTYQPRHISILAVSPVIRLQTQQHCFLWAQPYLELGIGASFLFNNHFGHRNLGGQFAFQDLLGLGLRWKTKQIWSLSYHYIHYSNAHLLPPNQGIDVKHLFSLGYEFN